MTYPEITDDQLEATFCLPYSDMGREGMCEVIQEDGEEENEPVDWDSIEEDPELLAIYTSIYEKLKAQL